MTVERRIQITSGVLILFIVGTVLILFWSSRQVEEGIKRTESTSHAIQSAYMMSSLMNEYLDHGGKRTLRQWDRHREVLGQILKDMKSESIESELLTNLNNRLQAVSSLAPQIVPREPSASTGDERQDLRTKDMLASLMILRLEQLVKAASDLNRVSQSVTLNRRHFVQKIIVGGGVSLVIIILINIYLIRKSVVNPLKALSNSAESIGAGNFDHITEIKSDDEVGKLAQAFNEMIERVRERTTALRQAKDELETKVAERTAELKAASAYNRSLIEASLDPLVTISIEGKISDVNAATRTVTGCSRDELVGTEFADYFTDPERAREGYQQAFRDGSVTDYELEIRHKDGHATPVMYNASLYPNESGRIAGVFAAARDITERKDAEKIRKKALETAEILKQIFSTTHFCIVFLDKDFNFITVNQAYADTCGYPPDFFPGKNHFDLYPHEENKSIFRRVVETGETFTVYARPFEFPDDPSRGVTYWDWTLHPVKDSQGHVEALIFILLDVTEREIAENNLRRHAQELVRSNADLQQFAYVASHDLQEPLRNVASCLQLLEKKYKNKLDANADLYIYHAVEASVRMKTLILDLLAYSRIGTKGKPPQRIDCEQILDQTVRNLRAAVADVGAVITHDPLPTISGDDTQLLQVFQNLIGNSIKFHKDDPPQIHVSAVKNKNEWIFSVRDNGIGIESRHLDRIFVIFQRLHKRSQYGGTGMGLAIVKKVVERHNGRVWVESEFGSGTTFYFTIPEKGTQT
jgi:PAS domain S-box-containing protein